jgi:hypothetical protein
VVPDLLSADVVEPAGVAPAFPVCDAGVFLLDDGPVMWIDSALRASLTTLRPAIPWDVLALSERQATKSRRVEVDARGVAPRPSPLQGDAQTAYARRPTNWLPRVESNPRFDVQGVASYR